MLSLSGVVIRYQKGCNSYSLTYVIAITKGVIGEVRCSFLRIYAPTSYSVVFLLHAPAPAPIKISLSAVRSNVAAVLRFGLDLFGSD